MLVTLTKRLGQNAPGTTIDTTTTQARWMFERGVAIAADASEQNEPVASTEQHATGDDTPKTSRGRRGSKTIATAKSGSE